MNEKIEDTIIKMLKLLVDQYHPVKVILFGSCAYGKLDEDSDIDLLIIKETQESFIDRWTTVGNILAEAHPSIPVDTLLLTPQEVNKQVTMGDQFIIEILEKGKLLYTA